MVGELIIINEYMIYDKKHNRRNTCVDVRCETCGTVYYERNITQFKKWHTCTKCVSAHKGKSGNVVRITTDTERVKKYIGKEFNSVKVISAQRKHIYRSSTMTLSLQCKCGHIYDERLDTIDHLLGTVPKYKCKHCSAIMKLPENKPYANALQYLINNARSYNNGLEDDFNPNVQRSHYLAFLNYKKFLEDLSYDPDIHMVYRIDVSDGFFRENLYLKERKTHKKKA